MTAFCVYCGDPLTRGEEFQHPCFSIQRVKCELSGAEGKPRCPWCDSKDVAPMIYGSPSAGFLKQLARTKSVWGGCLVDGAEPAWFCLTCGREWGRRQEDRISYCEQCGRPSSSTWCEDCVERAHQEAAKVFEDVNRELDRRERVATIRGVLLVLLAYAL